MVVKKTTAVKVEANEQAAGPAALLGVRFEGISFIDPHQGEFVSSCLQHLANLIVEKPGLLVSADDDTNFWPDADAWDSEYKPYIVKDGVLMLPIKGVLMNNFDYQVGDYATGYQYIEAAWDRAQLDPDVKKIALLVDSGGGAAAGNFELIEHMSEPNQKPVSTFVIGRAYSGGYSIATVGSPITAVKGAGVGSIGVVMTHVDYSKALDKQGIKVTFIYAGKHKIDGNPYEALSADVKKRMQKSVDATYQVFVSTVASGRGMDEQAVRDTEADCFTATEGLELGLIDTIAPFKTAIAAYRAGNIETQGSAKMPISDEAHAAAIAAAKTENETAVSAAVTAATTAAVSRIQSIMTCDEAKGKQALASTLAYGKANLSLEDCKAILGAAASEVAVAAPVEKKDEQQNLNQAAFEAAIGTGAGVKSAGGENEEQMAKDFEKMSPDEKAKLIVGDYGKAGGAGLKKAS